MRSIKILRLSVFSVKPVAFYLRFCYRDVIVSIKNELIVHYIYQLNSSA